MLHDSLDEMPVSVSQQRRSGGRRSAKRLEECDT
jgi:hypothetical protein